ncbi:DUF6928 family protein [Micromonospora taraxaci]|uniref:DUF6928 family protein n=1 Tax=Micromonospora taraxaci TaxID=1316803 RepID=UPI003F4D063C
MFSEDPYPLPFHPLGLGEQALRALFGFIIEGRQDQDHRRRLRGRGLRHPGLPPRPVLASLAARPARRARLTGDPCRDPDRGHCGHFANYAANGQRPRHTRKVRPNAARWSE